MIVNTLMYDGKNVAIVGPSNCVTENKREDIESYDLIVRINGGWNVPDDLKPHTGERTDVLYHNCTLTGRRGYGTDIDASSMKMVYFQSLTKCHWESLKDRCESSGVSCEDLRDFYSNLRQELSSKRKYFTSHGYLAINHILSYNVKLLYITGFTFYRQRYHQFHVNTPIGRTDRVVYKSEYNRDARVHDPERELRHFLNELYPKNKDRIRIDATLKKIMAMEMML